MQTTRVAAVAYLNSLPLIRGLQKTGRHPGITLQFAPPHDCARLLREGLVDVALIPSIEFARIGGLSAIPGTGVSSRHEVRSVILVSRRPFASIRSLAVDLNSRTSIALSRLLLSRRHQCRPVVEPMEPDLDRMLEDHDAALLIGDAALHAFPAAGAPAREGLLVLDLAREWNEMTGLPFVFAFWACRPVVPWLPMQRLLEESLETGLAELPQIVEEESARTGLPASLLRRYLAENIRFRLGPGESESLRLFYRMCREEGILDHGQGWLRMDQVRAVPASTSEILKSG